MRDRNALRPAPKVKGHKCLGARLAVEVYCECGWVSCPHTGEGARREAYSEWRTHVRDAHRKAEGRADVGADYRAALARIPNAIKRDSGNG